MFNKVKIILFLCLLGSAFLTTAATPLWAIEANFLGSPTTFHGYIDQESAWGLYGDQAGQNMSDYMIVQFEAESKISDKLKWLCILRGTADWAYSWNPDNWGSNYPNLPQFEPDWTKWYLEKTGVIHRNYSFMDGRNINQFNWNQPDDHAWEIFREFYFDIAPNEKLSFRIGKQQVGWGETDGLRLMDIINPLDMTKDFILRDSDAGYQDTRIPLRMIKGDYYFGMFGKSLSDVALELIWNMDIQRNRLTIGRTEDGANAFGAYAGEGGVWGVPYPNFPSFGCFNLTDGKQASTFKNSEVASRLKFTLNNSWMFTLNFFYGWQRDFVLKVMPGNAGSYSVISLPGFPGFTVPPGVTLIPPNYGLLVNYEEYYARMKIVGFTLNHDIKELTWRASSPVLRVEALYEFNKPFNNNGKSWNTNAINAELPGTPVTLAGDWSGLPGTNPKNGIVYKDQIRYVIGLDWQLWCKLLNPQKTFFNSFQFAHFITLDMADDHLLNAPFFYTQNFKVNPWAIPANQFFFSYLLSSEYDHGRILPLALFVEDLESHAQWLKVKCAFAYGDHWRPEIGFYYINGNSSTGKSFGLFKEDDQFYFKIKYQF